MTRSQFTSSCYRICFKSLNNKIAKNFLKMVKIASLQKSFDTSVFDIRDFL